MCDVSGEPLIHREDDKTEVVENRFKVYGETKAEIIDFYGTDNTIKINADNDPEEVYSELVKFIN